MDRAGRRVGTGERGVDRWSKRGGELGLLDPVGDGREQLVDPGLGGVDELAGGGTLLLGERGHAAHHERERPVGADEAGLERLELGAGADLGGGGGGLGEHAVELRLHGLRVCAVRRGRQAKARP